MDNSKFKTLNKEFYKNINVLELAKSLLGKLLINETQDGLSIGRVVETEAYLNNDPAAHSYVGKTERNKSVFEEGGTSYVYFIYGNYYCFNVVADPKDIGEAVLIRALEPIQGIDLMKNRLMEFKSTRKHIKYSEIDNYSICNGPGKLCIAMGINKSYDGHKLWNKPLYLAEDKGYSKLQEIYTTTRVGITKAADKPYRFYIKNSKYISRK